MIFAVVSCRVGFEDEYQLAILLSVSEGMLWELLSTATDSPCLRNC
jgi:hypothetical protein